MSGPKPFWANYSQLSIYSWYQEFSRTDLVKSSAFVADILGKSEVVLRIFLENLQQEKKWPYCWHIKHNRRKSFSFVQRYKCVEINRKHPVTHILTIWKRRLRVCTILYDSEPICIKLFRVGTSWRYSVTCWRDAAQSLGSSSVRSRLSRLW